MKEAAIALSMEKAGPDTEGEGILRFRISDSDGNRLGKVRVQIDGDNGMTDIRHTGDDGWCKFTGIPIQNYTTSLTLDGYKPLEHTVEADSFDKEVSA